MPNFLASNLISLRKRSGLNQSEVALSLDLKRSTYANYESQHTEPDLSTLIKISKYWGISESDLLKNDFSNVHLNKKDKEGKTGKNVHLNVHPSVHLNSIKDENHGLLVAENAAEYGRRILMPKVVTVDSEGNENILFVPVKARAGYLLGYGDTEYVKKLPAYRLPGFTNGSYRIFEVDGISMFNTLQDHDKVICRSAGLSDIRDGRVYVIVTKNDGVLIKRVINRYEEAILVCNSDNNHNGEFPPIIISIYEVSEVWYVIERWTRQLPPPGEIYKRLMKAETEITLINERLKHLKM